MGGINMRQEPESPPQVFRLLPVRPRWVNVFALIMGLLAFALAPLLLGVLLHRSAERAGARRDRVGEVEVLLHRIETASLRALGGQDPVAMRLEADDAAGRLGAIIAGLPSAAEPYGRLRTAIDGYVTVVAAAVRRPRLG